MRSGGGVLLISALELVSVFIAATDALLANQSRARRQPCPCSSEALPLALSCKTCRQEALTLQIVGVVLLGVFEGFKSHYFAGERCAPNQSGSCHVPVGQPADIMRHWRVRCAANASLSSRVAGIYNAEKKNADKSAQGEGFGFMSAVHLHAVNPSHV